MYYLNMLVVDKGMKGVSPMDEEEIFNVTEYCKGLVELFNTVV